MGVHKQQKKPSQNNEQINPSGTKKKKVNRQIIRFVRSKEVWNNNINIFMNYLDVLVKGVEVFFPSAGVFRK